MSKSTNSCVCYCHPRCCRRGPPPQNHAALRGAAHNFVQTTPTDDDDSRRGKDPDCDRGWRMSGRWSRQNAQATVGRTARALSGWPWQTKGVLTPFTRRSLLPLPPLKHSTQTLVRAHLVRTARTVQSHVPIFSRRQQKNCPLSRQCCV